MSDQVSEELPGELESRRSHWRRIVVAGVLLPLVAASLLIWSATGREDHIDNVPVAIVNNDTIITDPQPMAAGRSLTAALTHPATPTQNLRWVLSDQDDATAGLANGSFYAVLTIPSDFSSAILSSGTDQPVPGKVTLVSNSAASTTMPYLSQQVATAAAAALGNQVTVSYLGNVYDGFNSLAKGNQQAASGAASWPTATTSSPTVPTTSKTGPASCPRAWTRWPRAPASSTTGRARSTAGPRRSRTARPNWPPAPGSSTTGRRGSRTAPTPWPAKATPWPSAPTSCPRASAW